ncbi:transglutaminase family protein [Actinospica sp.]|uniref:transglutaminase family protein n=1 Tax=Actinospica sp. TaxID=1872142 RepID=UPI002C46A166|nr:transglutaminase family protein [Actinospica sp.]HWG23977.1 transglutaminase family protein [Actinospica sp.]
MSIFEPEDTSLGRWRIAIRHETALSYDGPVRASYNELRMTPLDTAAQTRLSSRVEVGPRAQTSQYTDYWGTRVTSFDLQDPHESLTINASSVVETSPSTWAEPDSAGLRDATWEAIEDVIESGDLAEFTGTTGRTRLSPALREELRERVADGGPHTAAERVCGWIHEAMSYVPGATGVHTSGREAWESKSGVCQDFSHIAIGMLRAAGLPARYVSGYLFPLQESTPGVSCEGQSHAWAEYWAGAWYGIDATNNVAPGLRHVVVGYGREYGDVVPHKGIYLGSPDSTLTVSVKLTRLA